VLIPLILVGLFSVVSTSKALKNISSERAVLMAKIIADKTNLLLHEEMKITRELSVGNTTIEVVEKVSTLGVENAVKEIQNMDRKLAGFMSQLSNGYESVYVADKNGIIFSDGSNGIYKGISVADREYFHAAKSGKVSVSDPIISKVTGNIVVSVCAPLSSCNGTWCGIIVSVIKIGFITDIVTSLKMGETGYPFMVDKKGLLIAHPNKAHILKTNITKIETMKTITERMLAGETGFESYSFEGFEKSAGFAPVEITGWSVGVTQNKKEFMAAVYSIRNLTLIVGLFFLLVTLFGVFWFARGISKPISHAVKMINDASDQVADSSDKVAKASKSIADETLQEASSVEETSAALEEMASMTVCIADSASQADNLVKEANKVIEHANQSMINLNRFMNDISRTGAETREIIKTISGIAFNTNLLALNAAVEAARAGGAIGAGFAVVADEIRKLALRTSDAAKNTADLIENSVKTIHDGSDIVQTASKAFEEVAASVSRVSKLVAEITAASNEQSQGISQISKAVIDIDRLIQQSAINAERSAAASEKMNEQAEQMKIVVSNLISIVKGVKF